MRTHRHLIVSLIIASAAFVHSASANAQEARGFALDRFQPSERGSTWFSLDSLDLRGRARPAVGLVGDWSDRPLVIRNANGSERVAVVEQQAIVHAGASLVAVDRLRLAMSIPVVAHQNGTAGTAGTTNLDAPSSSVAAGDLRVTGDVRVFGRYGDAMTSAVGVEAYLPTGSPSNYTSDGSFRAIPRALVAGKVGPFEYAGRIGVHIRAASRYAGSDRGSEVVFGGAAGLRPIQRLLIGPEIFGSTVLNSDEGAFRTRNTPLEVLLGGHFDVTKDVHAGVGVGGGLARGYGAPQLRGLAVVEWAPSYEEPGAPPPNRAEPTQVTAANEPRDRDNDGIIDEKDHCPDIAGVASDDPEKNGCPADRDSDGIADAEDACVDAPGVKTSNPKTNGCPRDRDADGIADVRDACPDDAGQPDADPKKNGCPRAVVTSTEIVIHDAIKFRFDSAELDPAGDAVLEDVRAALDSHQEIQRLRIEGHTDSTGRSDYNVKLSEARAKSVRTWLIEHGISSERLDSKGFGPARPLTTNVTEEGRRENRRVEFHIVSKGGKS